MEYLHVEIDLNGVKLEVVGNYWPGEAASWDSPGEPESVEIEQVMTANGDDIGAVIAYSDELQSFVEGAALEAFKECRIWQACEAAIARKEMMREAA